MRGGKLAVEWLVVNMNVVKKRINVEDGDPCAASGRQAATRQAMMEKRGWTLFLPR